MLNIVNYLENSFFFFLICVQIKENIFKTLKSLNKMSLLQKFEKFALTKEQGNSVKGGAWQRCRNLEGSLVDVWYQPTGTNAGRFFAKDRGQFIDVGTSADFYNCQS